MVYNKLRIAGQPRRLRATWRMVFLGVALIAMVAAGAYVTGAWRAPGSQQMMIRFASEGSVGTPGEQVRAVVNAPMRVLLDVPSTNDGSFDTALSSVSVELVDAEGKAAMFGDQTPGLLPMRPSAKLGVWEYEGSVPSRPGIYHARAKLVKLSNASEAEWFEDLNIRLEAVAETGPPLDTGYLIANDADIWLMSTDTSRQRRLTFFGLQGAVADKPAWSPDGGRIAFTYQPPAAPNVIPTADIWVMNADGSGAKEMIRHGSSESLGDAAWSSDGRFLYFTVETTRDLVGPEGTASGSFITTRSIDVMELATGARSRLSDAARMPASGPQGMVAYIEETGGDALGQAPGFRVVLSKPSGQDVDYAPPDRASYVLVEENDMQRVYAPRVSPDGKWVVYAATVAPAPTNGSDFDPLGWLLFSPRTAYAHGDPWDLFIVSTEGASPSRITTLNEDEPYAVWTSDSEIAFMGTGGLRTLRLDAKGSPIGEPQRIHEGETVHGGLSWRGP